MHGSRPTFSSTLSYISFSPSPVYPTGVSFYIFLRLPCYFYLVIEQQWWSYLYTFIFILSLIIIFYIIYNSLLLQRTYMEMAANGDFENMDRFAARENRLTRSKRSADKPSAVDLALSHTTTDDNGRTVDRGVFEVRLQIVLTWLPYDLILTSTIDLLFSSLFSTIFFNHYLPRFSLTIAFLQPAFHNMTITIIDFLNLL